MKARIGLKERMGTTQTLVALAAEAQELCRLILENQGEMSPELEKRLEFNTTALMSKVDNYVFIEDHLEMNANYWKDKAEACKAVAARYEHAQEKLRNRIKLVMTEMGRKELLGEHYRYYLAQYKPKVVISQPEKIPSECKMVIQELVPDKDKIKSLLEEGFEVPGASLEPVFALRLAENKEE